MNNYIEKYKTIKEQTIDPKILSTSSLYQPSKQSVLNYIKISYEHGQFTNRGPLVKILEERLSIFHNTKYCITFCSGFWALVAAIRYTAKKEKKYILMPSLACRRLDDAVSWAGFEPIYCEIN